MCPSLGEASSKEKPSTIYLSGLICSECNSRDHGLLSYALGHPVDIAVRKQLSLELQMDSSIFLDILVSLMKEVFP